MPDPTDDWRITSQKSTIRNKESAINNQLLVLPTGNQLVSN